MTDDDVETETVDRFCHETYSITYEEDKDV
jgi:hypothetical protein